MLALAVILARNVIMHQVVMYVVNVHKVADQKAACVRVS